MKKEKIIIFDTTLRDGEQSAGASMSVEDKVSIASKLDDTHSVPGTFSVAEPARCEICGHFEAIYWT